MSKMCVTFRAATSQLPLLVPWTDPMKEILPLSWLRCLLLVLGCFFGFLSCVYILVKCRYLGPW